ncbi:MAG: Ig-like domain-containing protein, partial [Acutalibacteraceae bacterium]|nr:Ig-like domain-containing protein [Acutalibacteraceae bacterium]
MESNPPILKKVATVLCAVSISVTAFVPSVGAVETLDFEQSTQPGLLTNSASIQTTEATTELPTEIITELPTEASTEAFTEPELLFTRTEKSVAIASNAAATITPESMTMGLNESYTVQASMKGTLTWTTSNSSVAKVSKNGTITAVGKGSSVIRCKSSTGESATCKISVKNAPTQIELDETSIILGVGEQHDFTSTVDAGAGSFLRTYASTSSIGLPTTKAGGIATAEQMGKFIVVCTTYNGLRAKCNVQVKQAPPKVSFDKTSVSLTKGKTCTLSPVIAAACHSNDYTFTTSNSNVAAISQTADNKVVVTAKNTGTAVITVKTYNGKTATCKVTVKSEDSTNLTISATATSILKGNHAYIKATATPAKEITYSSSNTAIAKVSSNGIVTGVSGGTATIYVKAGDVVKTCKITVSSSSSDTYVPYTTFTMTNGKTVYFKPYGSSFTSSDPTVATVDSKGFVTAKKQGVAIITADYYGSKRTCALTVVGADPIRFSYSSPNTASKNQKVALVAITDKQRTAVKFNVQVNGTTYSVPATSKTLDSSGERYIWKGYYTFTQAGEFPVTAYAMYNNNGTYSTCAAGKSTAFVTDVSSSTAVSYSKRRPSDEILALNASYEGFVGTVYDDPLVSDTPTVGYGYVVQNGDVFYNGMSKEEAFALMVSTMNDSYYASAVNEFMSDYNIKFNQQQFDALVMLVYNLGSGVLYNYDVENILLNCKDSYGVRNMNLVNQKELKQELIQWHHAGGCVWGLLYRRIDELEVFCYGDYVRDGNSNKYGMTYRWNCY